MMIHLVRYRTPWLPTQLFSFTNPTFLSKSTEVAVATAAVARASRETPSSGARYRQSESSCHSTMGAEPSLDPRASASTTGSSRRRCSLVLVCSWCWCLLFSNWEGNKKPQQLVVKIDSTLFHSFLLFVCNWWLLGLFLMLWNKIRCTFVICNSWSRGQFCIMPQCKFKACKTSTVWKKKKVW